MHPVSTSPQKEDSPFPLLEKVKVASPCSYGWENMQGDEVVRHCEKCQLRVYNRAKMPASAAEALLRESKENGERLCVRLFRRHDGTFITRDCPVGIKTLRIRLVSDITNTILLFTASIALYLGLEWGKQQLSKTNSNYSPESIVTEGEWWEGSSIE